MKEWRKVSCVKIHAWLIVAKKGTNKLSFYVFEYGDECSAESGAKYYFMKQRNVGRPTEEAEKDIDANFEFLFLLDLEF